MVALKAHQVDGQLRALDDRYTSFLFYGSDPGLVMERAANLAKRLTENIQPPGEIIRLDERDLSENPDRLTIEATTLPMFGGKNTVRLSATGRLNPKLLEDLIAGPLESYLIIESGNLKPTSKLRKIFEKSPNSLALPCFEDSAKDIAHIVDETFASNNIEIAPDVRRHLITNLGGNRAQSRSEIEKLVLFAANNKTVTFDDIDEVIGDSSALGVDRVINAALDANSGEALTQLDRLLASGHTCSAILVMFTNHMVRLHKVRAGYEAGGRMEDCIRRLRPPPPFKQQQSFAAQCNQWRLLAIAKAISELQKTTIKTRSGTDIERLLVERLILSLSHLARKSG